MPSWVSGSFLSTFGAACSVSPTDLQKDCRVLLTHKPFHIHPLMQPILSCHGRVIIQIHDYSSGPSPTRLPLHFLIEKSTMASPSHYSTHSALPSSPCPHPVDEPIPKIVVTLVGQPSINSRPLAISGGQMSLLSLLASRPRYAPSPSPLYLLAADHWCYQPAGLRLVPGCTHVFATQADLEEATTSTVVEDQDKAPIGMHCVSVRLQTNIGE
jgi:hypothetical protein